MWKISGLCQRAGEQLLLKLIVRACSLGGLEHAGQTETLGLAQLLADGAMLLRRLIDPLHHLAPSALS
ncbi:hypothetical protein D3C80_1943330 [compost metagenome]